VNLFELFVKVGVDDKASGALQSITSKLGNGLKTAAKIGTAAVGAASAGIVALTKSAIDSYAEYEQLVGGVETLFKGSAEKVQEYAANAYKTAGMSANEYMSTVTSFSASLLQSLGGDTDKAAEYANQALTDMSDNANKMGTSMEMIQNAYQGFAKQNYTMLDNLNTMGALAE
jgi:phage-related protein